MSTTENEDTPRMMEKTPSLPKDENMGVGITPPKSMVFEDDSFNNHDDFLRPPEEPVEEEPSDPPAPEDTATEKTPEAGEEPIPGSQEPEEVKHTDLEMKERTYFANNLRPIYARVDKDKVGSIGLFLAPTTADDLETFPFEEAKAEDLEWLAASSAAELSGHQSETLVSATARENSRWVNLIEFNQRKLGDHREEVKPFKDQGVSLRGSDAVEIFMAGTGLGRSVTIPLWHTGIWIKMRAASSAYLAEIDRAIAFSREELGLDVFGAIGSNDRLIFDEILVDAALKLVTDSSLPFSKNPLELKEYISYFDLDSLIWGMATAAYPEGCDIGIPCPSCRHVDTVTANLLRMRFVDESRLTAKQLGHMAKGFGERATLDTLKTYQEEFEILNTDNWDYKGRKFTYRTPTIEEYLISGRTYLSAIGRALTEALREDYTDDVKRAEAMRSMLDAEEACRYAHYVKEIRIDNLPGAKEDGYGVVSDPDTISQILRQVSGDFEATSDFVNSIRNYIVDAINTIIGFPNVKCSSCDRFYLNTLGEETVIVPFNPAVGFFTLAQHKISVSRVQPLADLTTLGARSLLLRALANGVQG